MPERSVSRAAQDALKAHAEFLRAQFARVGGGDGGDAVREGDARLQRADLAPVFEAVLREVGAGEPERGEAGGGGEALEGDVVDRQQRGRAGAAGADVVGGEARLPVVGVDDIGRPPPCPLGGDAGRDPRERGEAFGVVGPVLAVGAASRGAPGGRRGGARRGREGRARPPGPTGPAPGRRRDRGRSRPPSPSPSAAMTLG